jgi:ubiquinone/menaquinone biosynthesis C-methylase UbiE
MPRSRLSRSKSWEDRVAAVEQLTATPGFARLREEIIRAARLQPDDRVLDIGAGTGLLTLAAAPGVHQVLAVDISPSMCRHLETKLAGLAMTNVEVRVGNATELPVAERSVDVVLSNYCFHHLRDDDKHVALSEVVRVLRPGGRLVFGDMMFHVGLREPRDRKLIAGFVRSMLRRGPAGIMRLLKNALRVLSGRGEHPAGVEWWQGALTDAGFADVAVWSLDNEGGIAVARRTE